MLAFTSVSGKLQQRALLSVCIPSLQLQLPFTLLQQYHPISIVEMQGAGDNQENDLSDKQYQLLLLLVVTFILIITMLFEYAQHKLAKIANEELAPILEHLYRELTNMGIIGLIIFAVTKLGVRFQG